MSYIYRPADVSDAQGVYDVAQSVSRTAMQQDGADDQKLSAEGFLLYPLAADDPTKPNYEERIAASRHFWVAQDQNRRIVAFMMAYTFQQYKQMTQLTPNDKGVIEFFTGKQDESPMPGQAIHNDKIIYVAQVATHMDFKRKHIMELLMHTAFENASGSPAAIAEIAQAPMLNVASSSLFVNAGQFRLVSTRTKKDPDTKADRVSGTFMRVFPWPEISR